MGRSDDGISPWMLRLGIGLLVLMCVSLFQSCQELRYAIGGRTAQVIPQTISEAHHGRRGRLTGYSLGFNLDPPDGGKRIEGHVRVGIDEVQNFQVGQPIDIEYIGNEPSNFDARIKGTHHYFWVFMFFFFLVTLVGGFIWGCIHWNRVNAAEQRGRGKRK